MTEGALHDRVAIVTGAAGGLGAAYSLELARRGAIVTAVDLDEEQLSRTVEGIAAQGYRCSAHCADLTNLSMVANLFTATVNNNGRIDILVNNAGGLPEQKSSANAEDDLAYWDLVFDMNLKTALLCSRTAAEHMKRQRYGRIINVSSRAARSTSWYSEVHPAYPCAKLAIVALTRHMAKELGPYGVTVNCMVPSFAISGPKLQGYWDRMSEEEQTFMLEQTPLRRLPEPKELATTVAFLSSDESSYITGAALDVNGGSLMS